MRPSASRARTFHIVARLVSALVGAGLLSVGAALALTEGLPASATQQDLAPLPPPATAPAPTDLAGGAHGLGTAPRRSWSPPVWFPGEVRDELWVLDGLDSEPTHAWGPKVNAYAGIFADLDAGEILWARDPDAPRSIASVTKLVSSLTLMSLDRGVDLDRETCVTLEQWPTRPGARSKFETGDCPRGWDLLGAALVSSDNRGAFALPAVANEDYFVFVDRMNEVASDLGLRAASFADPAGIEDENMASARDVLKAVTAVSLHPDLSLVASAPRWRIETNRGPRLLESTNRLLRMSLEPAKRNFSPPPYDTIAAKTGYTDTARYCFATVVQSRLTGRRYGAVVLAAPNNRSRFDDVLAMLRWADRL